MWNYTWAVHIAIYNHKVESIFDHCLTVEISTDTDRQLRGRPKTSRPLVGLETDRLCLSNVRNSVDVQYENILYSGTYSGELSQR